MAIDLATGNVHITRDDVRIPGRVPLTWGRRYSTALLPAGASALGAGWTSKYFASVRAVSVGYELVSPDGDAELFIDPDGALGRGGVVRNLGSFQELGWSGRGFVLTRWDVDGGDVERLVFSRDAGGGRYLLGAVENLAGDRLEVEHDADGRPVVLRQPTERRALHLEYDRQGLLTRGRLTGPLGLDLDVFRYAYDHDRRLVQDTDAAGQHSRYEYDAASRLVRVLGRDGAVMSYSYDRDGRCVRYSGLDGYDLKRLRYLPATRVTELTDSYGRKSLFEFSPAGQVVRQANPLGAQSTFEYDEFGRLTAELRPSGAATTYRYDASGNRVALQNALGHTYQFAYNALHLPVLLVDPNGQRWERSYDGANRLVATADPTGATWRLHYDEAGNVAAITDPTGAVLRQRFQDGQVIGATDWLGNWTWYEYDGVGNIVRVTAPSGATTRYAYDVLDRLREATAPDGSTATYTYDAGGNVTSMADGHGQVITFRYGPCSRLVERVDAAGSRLRFVWGTEPGDLQAVVNERGERHSFVRDEGGRTVREVSFDGRVTSFTYDADGHLVRVLNGEDEPVELVRDAIGRVVAKRLPDGGVYEYEFDPAGNLMRAASPDAEVLVERDVKGRITKETQGEHWVESMYDVRGDVVRTRTSLGLDLAAAFDANRRLARLGTISGAELRFERDVVGNEIARTLPGGRELSMRYDVVGRLVEQRLTGNGARGTHGGAARDGVERGYRYQGQVAVVEDARWGPTSYVYDPAQRVLEANRPAGGSERFAYDENSNCVAMADPEGQEVLTYAAGNRLLRRGDTEYEFDRQGRLVRKTERASSDAPQVWTFKWDALDQLRSVKAPAGAEYKFEYDALGRRTAKVGPAGRTGFLWDKEVVIQDFRPMRGASGWVIAPRGFAPLACVRDGEMYPIITDHLGTPREMLDPSGRLVWTATFRTWGAADQVRGADARADCPLRFPGQWADEETGLHYNYFRYYDPDRGGFISQDPVGWEGGVNLYLYTKNPVNWIDPFGLTCVNYRGRDGQGYVIYHITDGKRPPRVLYVGITERGRFAERRGEHTESGRLSGSRRMVVADHADTYGQARGYEQAHIAHHGTLDTSHRGQDPRQYPGNRVNSYDPARVNDPSDHRAQTFDQHCQDKTAELNP